MRVCGDGCGGTGETLGRKGVSLGCMIDDVSSGGNSKIQSVMHRGFVGNHRKNILLITMANA